MGGLLEFFRRFLHCLGHVYEIVVVLNLLILGLGVILGLLEGIGLFDGVYFSYVTALAIGYGDISPHTVAGKFISIVLGIIGMILFGVIVGISTRTVIVMMHPEEGRNKKD